MPNHYRSKQKGFNLIELMVTVGILGILFSIAIPQYSKYSSRANRTDGLAILNEILQAQERFAAERGVYTTDLTDMGYSAAPSSADGHYVISASACDGGAALAECVLLTATAQGPQQDDDNGNGGDLTINSRGTKVGF
jgi:type IV pilus assembly protein PilE